MRLFHVVARTWGRTLCSPPLAPALWTALRAAFPDALSATLMPDHAHVIAPAESARDARTRLAAALSGLKRSRVGAHMEWQPTTPPPEIPDQKHLMRQIRYVALNPTRSRYVSDPLAWLWSTHRDVCGAVVDPWVTPDRLARALGEPTTGFARSFHAYVSSDPSVAVAGTAFPIAARPSNAPWTGLGQMLAATCAAHRVLPTSIRFRGEPRTTFLDMARMSGCIDRRALRAVTGASRVTLWRHAMRTAAVHEAAWLCLGDARLLEAIDLPDRRSFMLSVRREAAPRVALNGAE